MSRLSAPAFPQCHPGHASRPGPGGRAILTPVWICEYPYRTIRLEAPSTDCADCPVWQAMQRKRQVRAADDVDRLEHLLSC